MIGSLLHDCQFCFNLHPKYHKLCFYDKVGKRESDCRAENVRYKPIKIAHPQHSHRIQPITAIFPLFSSNLKSTISLTFNISIWNLNPSTSYSLQHVCWVAWSRPVPLLTDRPPSTQSLQIQSNFRIIFGIQKQQL